MNARLLLQQRVVKLLTCNFYCQTYLDSVVLLLIKDYCAISVHYRKSYDCYNLNQKRIVSEGKTSVTGQLTGACLLVICSPAATRRWHELMENITTRVFNRYILNLNTGTTGMTYNLLYFLSCFRQRSWLVTSKTNAVSVLGPAISDSDSILATSQQVFRKAWFISTLIII